MFGYRKLSEMKGVTGTYKEQHDKFFECAVSASRAAHLVIDHFGGGVPIGIDRILRADELIRQ